LAYDAIQKSNVLFSRKDLLNKLHNGFDISSFTDTNILLLIISGPTALLTLRVHNINNRPISLLSCVSKVLEKIIFKHVFNHLLENKLLYKFQSGFIPGHSTSHQLIELYHTILLALEAKQVTSVTFADISKAFDTVWVKTLLYKLDKYGIKCDLLCWLNSYSSKCTQRVMLKDAQESKEIGL
jgi:hypothetical protein